MEHQNPDIAGMDELFYQDKDVDRDGNMEIIAAFGKRANDPTESDIKADFVLRDNNGKIELLKQDFCHGGYENYTMATVKFTGSNQTYIVVGVTNYVSMYGIAVYQVDGDDIKELVYAASPTGAGHTYLGNQICNCSYGGYTDDRYSYDVLYYPVSTFYSFRNNVFTQQQSDVYVKDYPDNPKDVVLQYLTLKALEQNYTCDGITNRLDELSVLEGSIDMVDFDWYTAIMHYNFGSTDQYPYLTIDEPNDEPAAGDVVHVVCVDEAGAEAAYNFNCSYVDGKWRITSSDILSTGMNLAQIQAGDYSSLLGNWKAVAYSYNLFDGTGEHWQVGASVDATLSVTNDKIVFNDVMIIQGNTLTVTLDDTGPQLLSFKNDGSSLDADVNAAINWSISFYPKGVANFDPINGVKIDNTKNLIDIWYSGMQHETIFEQTNSVILPDARRNQSPSKS